MPRSERPLDPERDALQSMAADLRRLRERAGNPGYRELARRAHYSVTTLSDAAGGRKLPSLAVTLAYVAACGADPVPWEDRWRTVAAACAPPEPEVVDGDHRAPYPGLAAFQADDADRFFGRERLVAELVAQVRAQRFTAVFGPSGCGKSSLLRAGLLPAITRPDQPVAAWPAMVFTPGERPLHECASHLAVWLGRPAGSVLADLMLDPHHLHRAVHQAMAGQPDEIDLVLVIDQFEEVFTLCHSVAQRAHFVAALAAAAHASTSRLRVVLGIRADFYGRCAEHPDLVAALRAGQILVGGMNAEQLRAAITQPALRTGLVVETGLVATIVSEMVGRPGALPLMSHVLVETWRRRRGATLSLAGYQAAGELRGALAHTAERAYAALDAEQQRAARELFLRLIALRDGGEDTRRRLPRGELAPTDQTTTAVVDNLARARLLSVTADGIEIAHEALIRAWPRLAEWLAADRDGLRVHRQLTEAARTWDCLDRDPGALYRGLRLANAQDWDARRRTELTPTEREFLAASGAAAVNEHLTDRARSWLMWFLVATVMIMYGGLVVVGVVALRHR